MQLLISLEQRFSRTPDGTVWTQVGYGARFWKRYLEVFDRVQVLARVRDVPAAPDGWNCAGCRDVEFSALPNYCGPVAYVSRLREVREAIARVYNRNTTVIMRVPSFFSPHLSDRLKSNGHPYGLEVVGDPSEVFAPGVIRHPLRPFLRWWIPRNLRRQCECASAATYVTDGALQRRYPCPGFMTGVSDVDLSAEAFRARPGRDFRGRHLVTIASMDQQYKGVQHLLNAVARCVGMGLNLRLTVIGGGRLRRDFEQQSENLGLGTRVAFPGHLPAAGAVRAVLDTADLFVLPSLTEGLPRAMIEAMARSLPCIGTAVGGIPELLAPENMVPPGDAVRLAAKIVEVFNNPARMTRMSQENLVKARQFTESALRDRRVSFYRHLRTITEKWIAAADQRHANAALTGGALCG